MPTDEFIAHEKGPCAHLKEIGWEAYYGTTQSGNLSQYRRPEENPCGIDMSKITMPGITLRDFHYYNIKCPYSIQSDSHYVRNNSPLDPNYMEMRQLDPVELTDHTDTNGVMIRYSKGSEHGWLCVDDNCYYHTTVFSGSRYFYC